MEKRLFRPDEVAKVLNCSRRTVYRMIEERQIQSLLLRGALRVTKESIDTYIDEQIQIFMGGEAHAGKRGTP